MSQSTPLWISIAMATYNGEEYLQEQLDSFIEQTRQPDELIITDDCSTDDTESIVRKFAETAPFKVEFYRNEKNLGYCGNFNAALTKTTGDLVFLSDQDDVWYPEKIEHMAAVSETNPSALVVMNDAALTNGDLNETGLTKLEQIRSGGFPDSSFVMGCCCGIKRELLNLCMPIPEEFKAHDTWIVRFADGLGKKVIINEPLQYYRRHDYNESQSIANRTTKISKWDVLRHQVKNLSKLDEKFNLDYVITQKELFIFGIERALNNSEGILYDQLNDMRNKELCILQAQKHRKGIRKKAIVSRSGAVLWSLFAGEYKQLSGIKSAIRDFLG